MSELKELRVVIDTDKTYQVIESFGASGAWWSQEVGGWDNREQIAELLFDKDKGIGLTNYRYNIGAGSTSGNSRIDDRWRRGESFEISPFEYDWRKDSNAVWFLKRAVQLGVEEVVLFCNSPLERLTISGMAHGAEDGTKNLEPEQYTDFAKYTLDVTEHFVKEGVPVKYLSPINEPQWGWSGGQEGTHYEPEEVSAIYKVFVKELERKDELSHIELSGIESGEWGGRTKEYMEAVLREEELRRHFKTIDNHSYWTKAPVKRDFKEWMNIHYPDIKLRTSEWCEMVNGKDLGMDAAFNLAQEVLDDLNILEVVSWQLWIAVSQYNYRDGLIYVDTTTQTYEESKKLWAYGHFTKFIRPGYQRVGTAYKETDDLKVTVFKGEDKVVIVAINKGDQQTLNLDLVCGQNFNQVDIYTTTEEHNLECTYKGAYELQTEITLEKASIHTIILQNK